MATEGAFGLSGATPSEHPPGPFLIVGGVATTLHTLGPWLAARVADGGREATFQFEADERFARVRRVHGSTSSMLECRLSPAMTASELAQAVLRWAPSQAMSARLLAGAGAVRVTLAMRSD